MIHTAKGFGEVNKAETDVFLEVSCFFDDPADVGNLIYDSSPNLMRRLEDFHKQVKKRTRANLYLFILKLWLKVT